MSSVAERVVGRKLLQTYGALGSLSAMSDQQVLRVVNALVERDRQLASRWDCDVPGCDGLPHEGWLHHHARAAQRPPSGEWSEWLMMTGRGWGKTRTAAEMVRKWAETPGLQIAVLAKSASLVREICFESPKSGLLAVIPAEEQVKYTAGGGPGGLALTLRNGTVIYGFSAEVPDNIRGWAFDKAWCDEYAAWPKRVAQETYDMLWFCLREAAAPQVVLSTTPKALAHIKKLVRKGQETPETVVITRGHTDENKENLSPVALRKIYGDYEGTRLGRQELAGQLLEDVEGALWQQWMLDGDGFRTSAPPLDRLVVGVDPAVTSEEGSDLTAMVVAGRNTRIGLYSPDLPEAFVLHAEQDRFTPQQAMLRAAELYRKFQADAVVIEANNGGEYLPTVMRMVAPDVPVRVVHATRDKRARAAPVASLYEQGRVHHSGPVQMMSPLEEQMLTYTGAPGEKSPDLLDAAVWAIWDLMLDAASGGVTVTDRRLQR